MMTTSVNAIPAHDEVPQTPESKVVAAPTVTSTVDVSVVMPPMVVARGWALVLLATVALVFALQWAQAFFVPLVFGILIAYTINPMTVALERLRLPRVLAVVLVMSIILGGMGYATNSLRTEFQSIVNQLPVATQKLSTALRKMRSSKHDALDQVQAAATAIERATGGSTKSSSAAASTTPFQLSTWLWASSISVAAFVGQITVVVFLVFFLLASGNIFKRKLVRLTGPSLSSKKITVNILNDINSSIQKYMFMLLVTNLMLVLLLWGAFSWLGLENAGAWAVAGGLLHIVPYFGPLLTTIAVGVAAFTQFGTFSMALLVMLVTLIIATLIGTFVTTWMTGRIAKMNAAAVFIGLLFWGWLWGVPGLLLGIPIIVIIKVISEHVEGMQVLAELLSE